MTCKHSLLQLLTLTLVLPFLKQTSHGLPTATNKASEIAVGFNSDPNSSFKDSSGLIPVSSTVIPISNVFTRSRNDSRLLYPFASSRSRKSRLYEKSSKPSTPVRLITKNSPRV